MSNIKDRLDKIEEALKPQGLTPERRKEIIDWMNSLSEEERDKYRKQFLKELRENNS